jgi:hypothetical protein
MKKLQKKQPKQRCYGQVLASSANVKLFQIADAKHFFEGSVSLIVNRNYKGSASFTTPYETFSKREIG